MACGTVRDWDYFCDLWREGQLGTITSAGLRDLVATLTSLFESRGHLQREIFTGLTGVTFTLSGSPTGTVLIYKNGQLLTPDSDYDYGDLIVSLNERPDLDDIFSVVYD